MEASFKKKWRARKLGSITSSITSGLLLPLTISSGLKNHLLTELRTRSMQSGCKGWQTSCLVVCHWG
ncbi:unnamed protein product, partial [Vitis vinifera]